MGRTSGVTQDNDRIIDLMIKEYFKLFSAQNNIILYIYIVKLKDKLCILQNDLRKLFFSTDKFFLMIFTKMTNKTMFHKKITIHHFYQWSRQTIFV